MTYTKEKFQYSFDSIKFVITLVPLIGARLDYYERNTYKSLYQTFKEYNYDSVLIWWVIDIFYFSTTECVLQILTQKWTKEIQISPF